MVDPSSAHKLIADLSGKSLPGSVNSNKVCEVSFAKIQGLEENIRRQRNSPVNGKDFFVR